MSSNENKLQFWRNHLAGVERYPGSIEAYCRSQGISGPALSYWRKKFGMGERSRSLVPAQSFVPVEIKRDDQFSGGLPDPRWLADLILGLSVGSGMNSPLASSRIFGSST